MKRWGFTIVGARCKFKFLTKRSLRFLFKPWGKIYYKWVWFEKPFNLKDCIFLTSDGFSFVGYDEDFLTTLGKHEPYFQELFERVLGKGSVFIDVGAHLGGFTVRASRIVGERGLVVAFEPDFSNYFYLLKNIMLNECENVVALPLAVYSSTGSVLSFNISTQSGHSSITGLHKDEALFRTYVYTVTIDDVVERLSLRRVDVIKIDVEGAEIDVLKGCGRTLETYRPTLLIEVHGVEQHQELKKALPKNYSIEVVHTSPLDQWHKHMVAHPKR
jgi:FkbM family methyltransferase